MRTIVLILLVVTCLAKAQKPETSFTIDAAMVVGENRESQDYMERNRISSIKYNQNHREENRKK